MRKVLNLASAIGNLWLLFVASGFLFGIYVASATVAFRAMWNLIT